MLLLIILFIGIAGGVIQAISVANEIFDKNKKGFAYIKPKGWVYIMCTGLLILLPLIQKYFQDKEDNKKDIELLKKQEIRDSILQARHDSSLIASTLAIKRTFDSSNTNQTITISTTLGKYGYALDSAQKSLVRLVRDSSKTRVTERITESENPTLNLSFRGDTRISLTESAPGKYKLTIPLSSYNASSTGLNITYTVVVKDSATSKHLYKGNSPLFSTNTVIVKDLLVVAYYSFTTFRPFLMVVLYLKGSYTNLDKTKTFQIDQLYWYNPTNQRSGLLEGRTREEVLSIIASHKK